LNHAVYNENEINLRYLFITLFEFLFSKKRNISFLKELYFKKVISSYNPKIALGKDRYGLITKYKKLFPNRTSIFYEWGYTFDDQILMTQYSIQRYYPDYSVLREFAWNINLGKKNKVTKNFELISSPDYYFVLDERSQNFISKVFNSKFYVSGSIKNNEKNVFANKKIYDYMFVSDFRYLEINSITGEKTKRFNNCSGFVLKSISNYCKKTGKKYSIATSSTRKDKQKSNTLSLSSELNFYNKYATDYSIEDINSLELAEKSKVCVCTHSFFGYDLLARGKRVLFINTLPNYNWHFFNNKTNGPFWYCGQDESVIDKKLKDILLMSDDEWIEIVKKIPSIMKFDQNNTILKNLINNILKDKNKMDEMSC